MFDGGKVTEFKQNGNVFYIRPMNPFLSLRLLGDLQKLVAPVVGNIFAAFGDKKDKKKDEKQEVAEAESKEEKGLFDRDFDMAAVEKTFTAIAEHIDGDKIEKMCSRILDKDYIAVSIDGREAEPLGRAQLNELFTGNITDMFILVVEVLKVNYQDFTKLFKSLSGNAAVLKRGI